MKLCQLLKRVLMSVCQSAGVSARRSDVLDRRYGKSKMNDRKSALHCVFRKGMGRYLLCDVVLYHGRANPELYFVCIHSFVLDFWSVSHAL